MDRTNCHTLKYYKYNYIHIAIKWKIIMLFRVEDTIILSIIFRSFSGLDDVFGFPCLCQDSVFVWMILSVCSSL